MSNSAWERLTPEQQAALTAAAGVAEAYFDSTQREAEQRLIAAAQASGVATRELTRAEYESWLDLARRTAWADYVRQSPQAERLLLDTMQIIMGEFQPGK
jgi:TRAP-type C4-dicarboxylate transport system substrate-binding protein